MDDAEKLLRSWFQKTPSSIKWADANKVLLYLGIEAEENSQGHYQAFHKSLVGSAQFPFGSFTINCHAFGNQGEVHPKAIQDIKKAARLLQAAQQREQDDDN